MGRRYSTSSRSIARRPVPAAPGAPAREFKHYLRSDGYPSFKSVRCFGRDGRRTAVSLRVGAS